MGSRKNKVFILSKKKEVLAKYSEYLNDEVYYFEEDDNVMELVNFKPDYIIMPAINEVIQVSKVA